MTLPARVKDPKAVRTDTPLLHAVTPPRASVDDITKTIACIRCYAQFNPVTVETVESSVADFTFCLLAVD
jgi:hypothetical protein